MTDIQELLKLMAERGASDLFLTVDAAPHFKVEGLTRPAGHPVLRSGEVREIAYSVMSPRQIADFEESYESNLSYVLDGVGRFRVNVYYQRGEVAMVVRFIKSNIPSFEVLGLPAQCAPLAMLKRGLVLIVGAAGSGKSTTMASMIAYRAANAEGHILTIEDPVEYLFVHSRALVEQREVGIDTLSFGNALRNVLRAAPDVIVIGEVRDQETAHHALAYAETGHLCIATLHATNANEAIERILSFFPETAQRQLYLDLSLNLKAILSQRLLPATDGKLALATEVLLSTPFVADLIHKGRVEELKAVMDKHNDIGMHTLDQSLYMLHRAGRISLEQALRNADSQTDLALRIRLSEHHTVADAPAFEVRAMDPGHHSRK